MVFAGLSANAAYGDDQQTASALRTGSRCTACRSRDREAGDRQLRFARPVSELAMKEEALTGAWHGTTEHVA